MTVIGGGGSGHDAAEHPSEFAQALRGAIAARGVSLEALRRQLARHGVSVSVATLSYWQSGRSRPERASSLAAIGPLEEVLGVSRGSLGSRLPPVRRASREETDPHVGFVPRHDPIEEAVGRLGLSYYRDVTWTTTHDRIVVRADRRHHSRDVRVLLAAHGTGADRFPVWLPRDADSGPVPQVTASTNCHLGRTLEVPERFGVAVELLLDRPLLPGETTLVEYSLSFVGRRSDLVSVERAVLTPCREVVLEVTFDRAMLPTDVESVVAVRGHHPTRAPLTPYPTVHALFTDCVPGSYGIRWTW